MRAIRTITTITIAAMIVKTMVRASPMPKAAPGLRTAWKRSQVPITSIGSWPSSFSTTRILVIRSKAYARAATMASSATRRRPPVVGRSPFPGPVPVAVVASLSAASAVSASAFSGLPSALSTSVT